MKHKHADLMALYAQDAQETDKPWLRWEKIQSNGGKKWTQCSSQSQMFRADHEYRRIDPHREYKEAEARGEVVQYLNGDEWVDRPSPGTSFHSVDKYRIKPKPKTLYLWAYGDMAGWFVSKEFFETEEAFLQGIRRPSGLKIIRLDYTALEVEE